MRNQYIKHNIFKKEYIDRTEGRGRIYTKPLWMVALWVIAPFSLSTVHQFLEHTPFVKRKLLLKYD